MTASCRHIFLPCRSNVNVQSWYAAFVFLWTLLSSNHTSAQALNPLMNTRPRPVEPDLNSAGISLPAPSPSLTDHFGDLQTPGVNRSSNPSDALMEPSRQNPLIDWYTSQEKPWDPIQGRNPPPPRIGTRLNYRPSGPAFSTYRSSHAPSDCDTIGRGPLPSDSGYESLSRHRHSVIGGSIYGDCDRSGETASVSNGLAGLQFDRSMPSPGVWRQHGSVPTIDVPVNLQGKQALVCTYCNQEVKTKSELKYASLILSYVTGADSVSSPSQEAQAKAREATPLYCPRLQPHRGFQHPKRCPAAHEKLSPRSGF